MFLCWEVQQGLKTTLLELWGIRVKAVKKKKKGEGSWWRGGRGFNLGHRGYSRLCTKPKEPVETQKRIQLSKPYDNNLPLRQLVPRFLEYHWESANLICSICSVLGWFCYNRNNALLPI